MQITVETKNAIDVRAAMLVIPVLKLEDKRARLSPRIAAVDRALGGQIAAVIASGDFGGKAGESLLLYPTTEFPAERVQLLGLGEESKLSAESLRGLAGRALDAAKGRRAANVAICAPRVRGLKLPEVTPALAEGLGRANYQFDHYRERENTVTIRVVCHGPGLRLLRNDTSPVRERILQMTDDPQQLAFYACSNTVAPITKAEGQAPELIAAAILVPAGLPEIIELQRQGWIYLKP